LEPREFRKNQIICGQKESFYDITFLMQGEVEVGYNCDFYLYENGVKSAKELT